MSEHIVNLQPGQQVGPFTILKELGQGGMGVVYLAEETTLKRKVALKVMHSKSFSNEEDRQRFLREGQSLAKVSHPNVVGIHSIGDWEHGQFLAMEYIEGRELKDVIGDRIFIPYEALVTFEQILLGMAVIHESGLLHRDLKPQNILIANSGQAKIVDLGLAKDWKDGEGDLTATGVLMGSLRYLSPEVLSNKPQSIRSDIWALGVIFYEMLVGKNPFTGDNETEIIKKIHLEQILFPQPYKKWIPIELQNLIHKLCRKDESQRYQTISEVIQDLEKVKANYHLNDVLSREVSPKEITNFSEVNEHLSGQGYGPDEIDIIIAATLADGGAALNLNLNLGGDDGGDATEIMSTGGTRLDLEKVQSGETFLQGLITGSSMARPVSPVAAQMAPGMDLAAGQPVSNSGFHPQMEAPVLKKPAWIKYTVMGFILVAASAGWRYFPKEYKAKAGNFISNFSLDSVKSMLPEKLAAEKDAGTDLQLNPVMPEAKAKIEITQKKEIDFNWTGEDGKNVILQIARDPNFSRMVYFKEVDGNAFVWDGADENTYYFWRLAERSGNQLINKTKPRQFMTYSVRDTDTIVYPRKGSTLLNQIRFNVNFVWNWPEEAKEMYIQISDNEFFKTSLLFQKVEGTNFKYIKDLPSGEYYWRMLTPGGHSYVQVGSLGFFTVKKVGRAVSSTKKKPVKKGSQKKVIGNKLEWKLNKKQRKKTN